MLFLNRQSSKSKLRKFDLLGGLDVLRIELSNISLVRTFLILLMYKADNPTSNTPAPKAPSAATSIFLQAIQNLTPTKQRAVVTEIEAFFSSTYLCLDGDALNWWMVCVLFMNIAFMLLIVHLAATCS